jgi:hypothetical protein
MPTAQQRNVELYKSTAVLAVATGRAEAELVKLLEDEEIDGVLVVDAWLVRESVVREYIDATKARTKKKQAPLSSSRRNRKLVQSHGARRA